MSALLEEKEERTERRQYSDREKADALVALDANGGNVLRTARQLSIPHKTLDQWANGVGVNPDVVLMRNGKRELLARKSEDAADWIVSTISDVDVEKAGLRDKSIAFGVFVDKAQLLRGEGQGQAGTSDAAQIALKAVEALFKLALERNKEVTIGDVARAYVERKPELKAVLTPLLSE